MNIMGRVIIDQYYYMKVKRTSLKCKSEERAFEIQAKLPNVKEWKYYGHNARIPRQKAKAKQDEPSLNDMAVLAGLLTRQEAEELNPTIKK